MSEEKDIVERLDTFAFAFKYDRPATACLASEAASEITRLRGEVERLHQGLRVRGMRIDSQPAVDDALAAIDEWKGNADRWGGEVERLRGALQGTFDAIYINENTGAWCLPDTWNDIEVVAALNLQGE
jgi:hypothetical protein